MLHIHSMEYCTAMRINNLPIHIIWINLTNIMLSKEARHKRMHIIRFPLHKLPKTGKANLCLNLANLRLRSQDSGYLRGQ